MFGVLVSIGKKVGKVSEAGTWPLESFCIKKKFPQKSYSNSVEQRQSGLKTKGTLYTNNVFIDSR